MKKRKIIHLLICIQMVFSISSSSLLSVDYVECREPFFTLKALVYPYSSRIDYHNLIKQQLERIGINLEIIEYNPWLGNSFYFYDYDLFYVSLSGSFGDPDCTGIYNENGSLNVFKYRTEIDFNETLGTGINEWYMSEGTKIMPPNSQERINHYWAWEQYLMDKLCLLYPMFVPRKYEVYWSPLLGYNMTEGILRSWGKISWNGTHYGQLNSNEIVIANAAWSDLNPLFQYDSSSAFISSATMDSLIEYDSDLTIHPHLARSLEYLDDNCIRIRTREGIKWQTDPQGYFPSEFFNAEDVYFTFYSWKHVSNDMHLYDWIDDIVLVNETTLDIFIDGDVSTQEKEPFARALNYFVNKILPEHYLNKTQLADGVTPDITHQSWNTYATEAFGTGLFTINHFEEGVETILTINTDCWRLNETITNDPALNWNNRFGDFSDIPTQLRIRIIPDNSIVKDEFRAGKIDITSVTQFPYFREEIERNENWMLQSDIHNYLNFIAFNVQSSNEIIGDLSPCEKNTTFSKGLAIRKAICYVINREEINKIIHKGEYMMIHHPIHPKLGIWCNPNIIKYTHDIELAKYYMDLAGYSLPDYSFKNQIVFETFWIYILGGITYVLMIGISIFGLFFRKKARRKLKIKKRKA